MPVATPQLDRRFIAIVSALIALAAPTSAQAQLVNLFGNLVSPIFAIENPNGIPGIADNRGTSGPFPDDRIDAAGIRDLFEVLGQIRNGVDSLPPSTDPDETQERQQVIDGLNDIRDTFGAKLDDVFSGPQGAQLQVAFAAVNPSFTVQGINDVAFAVGALSQTSVLTSDSVNLAVAVIANADPFVILTGTITNTSDTQPLNIFLPFEEAFLEPIDLDAPLLRETFISTELRDTDGDGNASLRAAGLSFQVQATTDIDNPSLANTDPIGVSERLGLPRLRSPGVEFFLTDEAAPVDNSLFVSERAQISHATGQLVLEQLSPGDTVDFTAILSLGIEGDPLTPLIPTDSLRSLVLGAELVANATVPEPPTCLMLMTAAAVLRRSRPC